jgi:hypothetical protein
MLSTDTRAQARLETGRQQDYSDLLKSGIRSFVATLELDPFRLNKARKAGKRGRVDGDEHGGILQAGPNWDGYWDDACLTRLVLAAATSHPDSSCIMHPARTPSLNSP